ncbi:MAG: two-component regulator propeller domain-containing protein, partial [Saprospiraceae bacterium]
KGQIWLGGNDGLWQYDGKTFTNHTKQFVGYIYEDKSGHIWTNAEGQNKKSWVFSRYDTPPLPADLLTSTTIKTEDNMYFGIMEDKDGQIWFGTLRGVYRYDGTSFENFRKP